jgi:hypothetical protein
MSDAPIYRSFRHKSHSNHLLIRSPLGRKKPDLDKLPSTRDAEFGYGKPSGNNAEGAGEIISSWQGHQPKQNRERVKRDFVRTNRAATLSGATTSKMNATYRRDHDMRVREISHVTMTRAKPLDPNATYGRPSGEPANLGKVLNNEYLREWEVSYRRGQLKYAVDHNAGRDFNRATRASQGHASVGTMRAQRPRSALPYTGPSRQGGTFDPSHLGYTAWCGPQSRALSGMF